MTVSEKSSTDLKGSLDSRTVAGRLLFYRAIETGERDCFAHGRCRCGQLREGDMMADSRSLHMPTVMVLRSVVWYHASTDEGPRCLAYVQSYTSDVSRGH